jgi:hypothetical protein
VIGRGIGIGVAVFAVLSALCLLSPLRSPVLAVAGRDTPALEHRLRTQRDTLDALQKRASETRLYPAERAALDQVRNDFAATRERIDARSRMNARLTLLGLFDAVRELFPWLLAFGFALPVFGGLIGAQVVRAPRARAAHVPEGQPRPASVVTPVPVPPPSPRAVSPLPGSPVPPLVPATPAPTPKRAAYVHPAAEPPARDWGFRHQPTPLESRPRAKMPPVRSPHADAGASEDTESPLAG